jgi:hypothetical protein
MTRAPVVTAAACTRRLPHATAIHATATHATATHATAIATPGPCPRSEWKHS